MNTLGDIELEILALARQGRSRVEFKKNVSKLLCSFLACTGIDIEIHEKNMEFAWMTRLGPDGTFSFSKGDNAAKSPSYRRDKELEKTEKETLCIPINIDSETTGLVTYIRGTEHCFSPKEKDICRTVSGILAAAISFRNTQAALRERIKELTCLYDITKIMQKTAAGVDQTLHDVIKTIPCAFQYDDIATSRIILDGKEYICGSNRESNYSLRSDIIISGENRGLIEVLYKPIGEDLEEKPFLLEEQNLLDGIAKQLSLLIEEQEAAEEKKRLENQLRHADRLATIGQLAAGVAHEINEPLANILGFSELIKKTPGLSEQTIQDLDKIIKASMFARETVKKLLVFASQIQPGGTETNINDVITEGMQFFESRCEKENIEIVTDLQQSLPPLTADPGQLNQVFINLFVNAMQAMPEGGKITISSGSRDSMVYMSITDNGSGIPDKIREKIFLPFFTTKETGKGTGLGLPVVHGIVHAYHGQIEIYSEEGKGTSVTVLLPRGTENGTK